MNLLVGKINLAEHGMKEHDVVADVMHSCWPTFTGIYAVT
jgi:hypothetical protein